MIVTLNNTKTLNSNLFYYDRLPYFKNFTRNIYPFHPFIITMQNEQLLLKRTVDSNRNLNRSFKYELRINIAHYVTSHCKK